ncbi:hypothetical protein Fmac_011424 [Flemingia macrophylla]|uniref:Uncharacterized protein n=1 Tax=Flemingia macrophylla TaxID=520843 RepID=A0ABD1MN70_9FABA
MTRDHAKALFLSQTECDSCDCTKVNRSQPEHDSYDCDKVSNSFTFEHDSYDRAKIGNQNVSYDHAKVLFHSQSKCDSGDRTKVGNQNVTRMIILRFYFACNLSATHVIAQRGSLSHQLLSSTADLSTNCLIYCYLGFRRLDPILISIDTDYRRNQEVSEFVRHVNIFLFNGGGWFR